MLHLPCNLTRTQRVGPPALTKSKRSRIIKDWQQADARPIYDHFALVREVDRDPPRDVGLDLSDPPIRAIWMAHTHTGRKDGVEIVHGFRLAGFARETQGVSAMSDTDLAGLIAARICHDVISPVGAIANGLELLALSGDTTGPEFDLTRDSARHAEARLRFFRLAFGAVQTGEMAAEACDALLQDMAHGARFTASCQIDGAQPKSEVKSVCLAVLCLETALAFGGHIVVTKAPTRRWSVVGDAARLREDPPLWEHLTSGTQAEAAMTPALVHFALLRQAELDLSVKTTDTRIEIRI